MDMDRHTREKVGYHIGDRSVQSTQCLWDSLPETYRQQAICYPDFWEAYQLVFPKQRLSAIGKETGLTNHLERFNNTLRQRVCRLVRKTLSFSGRSLMGCFSTIYRGLLVRYTLYIVVKRKPCFSRRLENHMSSVLYFIHHYNAKIHTRLLAS